MYIHDIFYLNKNLPSRFVSRLFTLTVGIFLLASCSFNTHREDAHVYRIAPLGKPPASQVLWSPIDSAKILVGASYSGFSEDEIYLLDTATGEKKIIAQSDRGKLSISSWSPDGSKIILSAEPDTVGFEQGALWIVDVNDGSKIFLQEQDSIILWGPTQNQYTIVGTRKVDAGKENTEISLVDLNTGEETKIYSADGHLLIFGLSWSPDRKQLALSISPTEYSDANIFILDLKSAQLKKITKDGDNSYPVWSPVKDLIAYRKKIYNGNDALYSIQLIDSSGSCNIELLNAGYLLPATWSPSGDILAFIEPNADGIFAVNVREFLDSESLSQRCK